VDSRTKEKQVNLKEIAETGNAEQIRAAIAAMEQLIATGEAELRSIEDSPAAEEAILSGAPVAIQDKISSVRTQINLDVKRKVILERKLQERIARDIEEEAASRRTTIEQEVARGETLLKQLDDAFAAAGKLLAEIHSIEEEVESFGRWIARDERRGSPEDAPYFRTFVHLPSRELPLTEALILPRCIPTSEGPAYYWNLEQVLSERRKAEREADAAEAEAEAALQGDRAAAVPVSNQPPRRSRRGTLAPLDLNMALSMADESQFTADPDLGE
jgi:hypothetical protein